MTLSLKLTGHLKSAQQQPLPPLHPRCGTLQVKQQLLQVELLEGPLLGPLKPALQPEGHLLRWR